MGSLVGFLHSLIPVRLPCLLAFKILGFLLLSFRFAFTFSASWLDQTKGKKEANRLYREPEKKNLSMQLCLHTSKDQKPSSVGPTKEYEYVKFPASLTED